MIEVLCNCKLSRDEESGSYSITSYCLECFPHLSPTEKLKQARKAVESLSSRAVKELQPVTGTKRLKQSRASPTNRGKSSKV
jgi:hypothetical protein